MEQAEDIPWRKALHLARRQLARWGDPFTASSRDDIAQECAVSLWQFAQRRRGLRSWPHALGVILPRTRRVMRRRHGPDAAATDALLLADSVADVAEPAETLEVDGLRVPKAWLMDRLDEALARLRPALRQLLSAYYEGFSCGELAERFGISETLVKVRLHRGRARLRMRLEAMARAAGGFEPS